MDKVENIKTWNKVALDCVCIGKFFNKTVIPIGRLPNVVMSLGSTKRVLHTHVHTISFLLFVVLLNSVSFPTKLRSKSIEIDWRSFDQHRHKHVHTFRRAKMCWITFRRLNAFVAQLEISKLRNVKFFCPNFGTFLCKQHEIALKRTFEHRIRWMKKMDAFKM